MLKSIQKLFETMFQIADIEKKNSCWMLSMEGKCLQIFIFVLDTNNIFTNRLLNGRWE